MEPRFSLRWNNYPTQLADAFGSLLLQEDLVDVTLSCEGKKIKAHKMMLSACSPYFHGIFKENPCQHPVIVFKNVPYADLKAIVEFIYCGEVSVAQDQLESFLNTAGELEVKGLADKENEFRTEESTAMVDEDKMQTVTEEQTDSAKSRRKKPASKSAVTSGHSSPVPKKRKPNDEKLEEASSPPLKIAPFNIKEEVEEVEEVADATDADVSNSFAEEGSPLRNDAEASNCTGPTGRYCAGLERNNLQHSLVKGPRVRCRQCSKSWEKKLTSYTCVACVDNRGTSIGLCPTPCYAQWHMEQYVPVTQYPYKP